MKGLNEAYLNVLYLFAYWHSTLVTCNDIVFPRLRGNVKLCLQHRWQSSQTRSQQGFLTSKGCDVTVSEEHHFICTYEIFLHKSTGENTGNKAVKTQTITHF